MATTGIERMARAVEGPLWFQLYVLKDFDFNHRLVRQAEEFGYSALVVTVDLQAGAKREKDLRNGISIPLRPSLRHVIEGIAHPGWSFRLLRGGLPQFENVRGYLGDTSAGLTIAARVGRNLHAGFGWDDFRTIRDWWKGPLIVKGVLHPDDAVRLIAEGADGIWVSNHGGRQLDGAVASIDAIGAAHAAVGDRAPILIDSGIRTGMDVIKAKARGSAASAIGRAVRRGGRTGRGRACAGYFARRDRDRPEAVRSARISASRPRPDCAGGLTERNLCRATPAVCRGARLRRSWPAVMPGQDFPTRGNR